MRTLVKFSKGWADEFDVDGFVILTAEELPTLLDWIEKGGTDWEFGTNEGWEEGSFDMSDFTFTEITDEEAEYLYKLFPELVPVTRTYTHLGSERSFTTGGYYGHFPDF